MPRSEIPLKSPLRYPGGKKALSGFLSELIDRNACRGGTYVEPYAGGAGAALALLGDGTISRIVLNDGDPGIAAFWRCVLFRTDELCRRIVETDVTTQEYARQKTTISRPGADDLDLGFATLFLNRCNRSGILNAGIIGGKKQEGACKIGDRFPKEELVRRIRRISSFRDRITVSEGDAIEFLSSYWRDRHDPASFVYLDPPYVAQGPNLYRRFYVTDDHRALCDFLRSMNGKRWVLSYDDHPSIRSLYEWSQRRFFNFRHTAQQFKKGRELVVSSAAVYLPEERNRYSFETDGRKLRNAISYLSEKFELLWKGLGSSKPSAGSIDGV